MFKVEVHKADAWLKSSELLTSGSSKAYKATFSFIHPNMEWPYKKGCIQGRKRREGAITR